MFEFFKNRFASFVFIVIRLVSHAYYILFQDLPTQNSFPIFFKSIMKSSSVFLILHLVLSMALSTIFTTRLISIQLVVLQAAHFVLDPVSGKLRLQSPRFHWHSFILFFDTRLVVLDVFPLNNGCHNNFYLVCVQSVISTTLLQPFVWNTW